MKKLVYIFILLWLITGCNQQRQKDKKVSDMSAARYSPSDSMEYLFQNWNVIDADHPMVKDVFNNHDTAILNFPGLVFLNDSFIVENPRGELRYGNFSRTGKQISAAFNDGGKATYTVKQLHATELQLQRNEKNSQTLLYLKADGKLFRSDKKNPFDPSLNQWRVKPKKPETKEEIRLRLKQYLQFYAAYFYDNIQRGTTEINFLGLPCCFKWYKGGIYIQNENKLDKKFILCFYSKDQALEARQILEDALGKKYNWDTNEPDWLKQTAPVLEQMRDSI